MPNSKDTVIGPCKYAIWGTQDYWTLNEAIRYIVFYNMGIDKWNTDNLFDPEYNDVRQGLIEVVRKSLISKTLIIDEKAEHGEIAFENTNYFGFLSLKIKPKTFIEWAVTKKLQLPNEFLDLVSDDNNQKILYRSKPAKNTEKALRTDQKARERCRAIAEMLWEQDHTIKIKDMKISPAIKEYGTRGMYEPKTVYGWIKDLAPKNRKSVDCTDELENPDE